MRDLFTFLLCTCISDSTELLWTSVDYTCLWMRCRRHIYLLYTYTSTTEIRYL